MLIMNRSLLIMCGLLIAGVFSLQAQYSIDWYSIDGGGGTSTGGVYSVSGTIGQPDAGTLSGGNYTLQGGFWAVVVAVQTPGAPTLSIQMTATNSVVVSWPAPSTGWVLQDNGDAGNTNTWGNVSSTPITVGPDKQVIVAPPAGNRFYRLKQ
jgi:hypothetical protein